MHIEVHVMMEAEGGGTHLQARNATDCQKPPEAKREAWKRFFLRLVVARGRGGGGGMDWEFGISRCKLIYRMDEQRGPAV